MDGAPAISTSGPSSQPPNPVVRAWPRPAQLATAFLLCLASVLITIHVVLSTRWFARPTEQGGRSAFQVDLNKADRAELLQLPGIGPHLAERIEEVRREHGPFLQVAELTRVPGVGPALVERLREWVYVRAEDSYQNHETHFSKSRKPLAKTDPVAMRSGKKSTAENPIDINNASGEELRSLPGIGPVMSKRILEERQKRPFKSVEDLRRVAGIGPKILDRLRPHVVTGSASQETAAAR